MMVRLIFVGLVAVLLISCQNEKPTVDQLIAAGDVEQLKKEREVIQKNINDFRSQLTVLDDKIAELDPAIKNYTLVTTVPVEDTVLQSYVKVQGNIKTKDDNMIYPEYAGQMTQLLVREGQYIKKGQLIAVVDDGGLKQQIAQQNVQAELAKTTFERQKRLWEQNIGTEIQYLQAKNNYEAFLKGIEAAQQQLKKVNVYAPFSGVVETIITKQGQVVSPGATPIIRLVGLSALYLEAEVPERFLQYVKVGTKVNVEIEALDKEFVTKVRRINSTINPANRTFIVEMRLPKDKLLKPNLIASVAINDYTNDDALLIPSNVIGQNAEGQEYVYVVDNKIDSQKDIVTVKKISVETGKSTESGLIEIMSGLKGDELVVAEGAKTITDGEEVQLISRN